MLAHALTNLCTLPVTLGVAPPSLRLAGVAAALLGLVLASENAIRRQEIRTRAIRQSTIRKRRHKLALELQVIDDGPGVPEEIQDRIFNPLVSGREGGTGLGLSLAQTFVHYHHGVVEFESQPGRTIFRILLPIR